MGYIITQGAKEGLKIKQSNKHMILVKDGVYNLKQANQILKKILEVVFGKDDMEETQKAGSKKVQS